MSPPFITVGDKTSHGGTVISGDQAFLIHGKAVAGIGDLTVCPHCKGAFPITSGAEDMMTKGKAPAREGDRTACGAILIAAQAVTIHVWNKMQVPPPPLAMLSAPWPMLQPRPNPASASVA
ncbi:putative Zn-binding protein involved in type VI secretion [Herbaspirillum rubrisubalbicans]|uniref:PAAR domain-containing protein n=1 Tax=Herbaspirillum rubrisubalbicans TaxID=80842 RepID=UPI0020A19062|nr:PAAR domain-containing protein [Herbaspirillum rubrisubalbicans]MCP1573960.1 putative Zn-binding protein involved in type VI secretion [Herbaspirillum rubrisubalbicans]